MTSREKELIRLIKQNPFISQEELSRKLGIKRSSVAVQISNLMKKGHILGKGYIIGESQRVIVIGGSNMDLSGVPDKVIRMKDSNVGSIHLSVGGVGRNIADNLARLDVPVSLITGISEDIYGKKIFEECNAVGIDMSYAIVSRSHPSAMYLSILDNMGDMMVALVDSKIHEIVTPMELQRQKHVIGSGSHLVIDTNLSEEAIHYIAENFKEQKIFADTVSCTKAVKLKPVLSSLYAIKPNKDEVEILSDVKITDEASLNKAMDVLLEKGVKNIYISMGEKGVFYGNKNQRGFVQTKPCKMISATGAGDAMMAGLVYGELKGFETETTIAYGQAMARMALSSEETISSQINPLKIKQMVEEDLC
ncbi:MAG: PfkB family carbohydrate kinase [Filifactoraceae bacterium]